MDQSKINHYGDELYTALKTRTAVAPLTDRESDITIEDAYNIQLRMIQRRLDAGEKVEHPLRLVLRIEHQRKVGSDAFAVQHFGHAERGRLAHRRMATDLNRSMSTQTTGGGS